MQTIGIQKLTLLDFPGKTACILFTPGCNFRCPFCHNASLVNIKNNNSDGLIDKNELFEFFNKRKGLLDGVVITGGEPTLQKDLFEFIYEIRSNTNLMVKLDTNGSRFYTLEKLIKEKIVDYVAMDIKNSPKEYSKAIGTNNFDIYEIEKSKNLLLENNVDYEFRTTLVDGIHNKENIIDICNWIKGADKYFLQMYKNTGTILREEGLNSFSPEEMENFCDIAKEYIPQTKLRVF